MAFVLKIKYEESLRRLTVPKNAAGAPVLSFDELEAKIREFFNIPAASKIVVTYTDKDDDVVTMAEDCELHDACVLQGLNPLRITVTTDSQKKQPSVQSLPNFGQALRDSIEAGLNGNLKSVLEPLLKDGSERAITEITQLISKISLEPEAKKSEAESSSRAPPPPKVETAEHAHNMENGGVFHHNVQCDGCGMSPIKGPRFKSMLKDDYDLCVRCFQELPKAAESEYARYDRPIQRHHYFPFSARPGRCPALPHRVAPRPPHSFRCDSRTSDRFDHSLGIPNQFWASKPDGRFVCDATVPDGTEVSPGTAFVKIWRLRNSGKVPWTHGTQLVRVGGDELGSVSAVTLQLPEGGVLPDAEVDVAVDLLAPERDGRYVSYWRLMTPSGVKFGHRVWALIQVTSKTESVAIEDSDDESEEGVLVVEEPETELVQPVEVTVEVTDAIVKDTVEVKAVAEEDNVQAEQEPEKAIEIEGFSVVDNVAADQAEDGLEKLAAMGFKDQKLNLELLEKNEFDVQRTLEDLFSAAEWDHILDELEEMGFYDGEMNRRLMIKNKGSVKHVVKDLVKLYKPSAENSA